jgi:8-oxo-dGTP pyrophosphatase MutT (NUDIX family)
MEFVRGKYETSDKEYIHRLVENMTSQEQLSIVTNNFETLWSKLWGNSRDKTSAEFEIAETKFNNVDKSTILCDTGSFSEAEWGFPKGRRSRGETDLQCAVREFNEETNISEDSYKVIPELIFTEVFTALNNIKYKHIYFVACLKSSKLIDTSKKMTPMQSREISAVSWKTLKECVNITRPHYTERIKMIEELSRKVSVYETLADKQ